jgi:hypothetical protein
MATSDNAEGGSQQATRLILEQEMAALAAIKEYRSWRFSEHEVPDRVTRQLAEEALAYREVLNKYRNDGDLDPSWDERPIHWIETKQRQVVQVEQESPRRNANTETVTKPAILAVDPEEIIAVIRELEDVANELGFKAPTPEYTEEDEVTPEDLAGLLHKRGQHKATEQLPARFQQGHGEDDSEDSIDGQEADD